MKKTVLFLICSIFLSACTTPNTLHSFSVDARSKDVALENLIIVSNGTESYIQPTYHLFAIEHANSKPADLVKQANMIFYDEEDNLFFTINTGANQDGILDTRTTLLDDDLVGFIAPSKNIEPGKNIFIEFVYEKDNQQVTEKVEVALQENN
ncbi:hypothetical protein [Carnobacterium sp.]|uniref:hypothetical protein n=1 Tax=Carnobacterium sp. TaxID=48221 RepID=UPI00388D9FAD